MQVYTCNNMNGTPIPYIRFAAASANITTGTFPLKQTQGFFNDSSHPRVVEKYGCVVLEVEDWIDGINHPEWGRDPFQIFGPDDGPYVLEAMYKFSISHALSEEGKPMVMVTEAYSGAMRAASLSE